MTSIVEYTSYAYATVAELYICTMSEQNRMSRTTSLGNFIRNLVIKTEIS
jgi:hypothetical protein